MSNCTYASCLFLISNVFFLNNLYHGVAFLLRIKMYKILQINYSLFDCIFFYSRDLLFSLNNISLYFL